MRKATNFKIVLIVLLFGVSVCLATQYEYDSLNRLSKVIYDNNVQIVYAYDNSGNQTARAISLTPDITRDEAVDMLDLVDLAAVWLDEPCVHPGWCGAGDLDLSGKVDLNDFTKLGRSWLEGTIVVPDVVGLNQEDAEAAILAAGLVLGTISEEFSDTVAVGYVINQVPSADTPIRPGESINLVISKGVEPVLFSEDFETGNFIAHPWQQSGNAAWVIVSDTVYEGLHAAKSGTITDSQQSTLEITLDTQFQNISFYRKVSSEGNYDYLRFYVDGTEKANWSGTQDWAQQTYVITPGQHTFKWSYTKDGSVSSGSDCVWIDNILLY